MGAVNAANLVPGVRYRWGWRSHPDSRVFVRYEIVKTGSGPIVNDKYTGTAPVAIFIDVEPRILDHTAETEMCVGVSGLINSFVEEVI